MMTSSLMSLLVCPQWFADQLRRVIRESGTLRTSSWRIRDGDPVSSKTEELHGEKWSLGGMRVILMIRSWRGFTRGWWRVIEKLWKSTGTESDFSRLIFEFRFSARSFLVKKTPKSSSTRCSRVSWWRHHLIWCFQGTKSDSTVWDFTKTRKDIYKEVWSR